MKKKKLFIHIGTPKTGTKALQRFCSKNRSELKKHGVCYPIVEKLPNAQHSLSWCFDLGEEPRPKKWPENMAGPKQEWGQVIRQLTAESNIISSETFFDTKPERLLLIKDMLGDFEVKIIVYWRRMDSFVSSWCAQPVKSSNETDKFSRSRLDWLPTKEKLDGWANVFGKENLILRPYERCQLYKNDIVSDFFHHNLDMELTDKFMRKDPVENRHLHQIALEYKRLVNYLFKAGPELQRVRRALQDVSVELARQGRKDYSQFSPTQRLKYALDAQHENEAIAIEYFGKKDGKLFLKAMPDPDEPWQAYDRLLAEDAKFINQYFAKKNGYVQRMIAAKVRSSLNSARSEVKEAGRLLEPGLSRLTFRDRMKVTKGQVYAIMPSKVKHIVKKVFSEGSILG